MRSQQCAAGGEKQLCAAKREVCEGWATAWTRIGLPEYTTPCARKRTGSSALIKTTDIQRTRYQAMLVLSLSAAA